MIQHCTEFCGWLSAFTAAFAFGSYGVPIKLISVKDVDPLVLQTYKTAVCFMTCWLVIPIFDEKFAFTSLGIISGQFWVLGGVAGIFAIRNAGLAVSVGTWCSLSVITSFSWGIFVFSERLRAFHGMFLLIIGLIGMSIYASPEKKDKESEALPMLSKHGEDESISSSEEVNTFPIESTSKAEEGCFSPQNRRLAEKGSSSPQRRRVVDATKSPPKSRRLDRLIDRGSNSKNPESADKIERLKRADRVSYFGGKVRLSRRQLGILCAVVNGTWGSCKYVPMHYARDKNFNGAGYLISYSCGSIIVIILAWICRYLYNVQYYGGNFSRAYHALPSFHFKEMWMHGFLAGFLWSLGNLCSLIAVSVLGQGVGVSFVQSSMLVSGLWGISFGEIKGFDRIMKWLLSSFMAITGIVWISFEREST